MSDVERYDSRDNRNQNERKPTHTLGRIYGADFKKPDAVRAVGPSPDYALIRSWLKDCNKEHRQCIADGSTDKLKSITLIDVRNQRLVSYKPGLQYVALSYVWGLGVPIPKRIPGQPSSLPNNISKTIRHAMVVADNIGVPFLWADAVCINQHDPKEKNQQLPLMDYIYEQAFATVVSLGDSANIGLPGLESGPPRHPQLAVEFGPQKFLARCPTLQSEVQNSMWSTRGWTYQEGLFSRRCIFFSQHQAYFHCNGIICTEDSPKITRIEEQKNGRWPSAKDNGYRTVDVKYVQSSVLSLDHMQMVLQRQGMIPLYTEFLGQYLHREISYEEDAINAFGAILSRLQRDCLPKGFLHGLPKNCFADSLLWSGYRVSRRRDKNSRLIFPSWSWAGWKAENGGSLGYSLLYFDGASIDVPLEVMHNKVRLQFTRPTTVKASGLGVELQRYWNSYRLQTQNPILPTRGLSASSITALHIDGPVMTLPVTCNPGAHTVHFTPPVNLSRVAQQFFPATPPSRDITLKNCHFLVLKSVHNQDVGYSSLIIWMMLLHWEEGNTVASRAGLLGIQINQDLDSFWKFAGVHRRVFWLV